MSDASQKIFVVQKHRAEKRGLHYDFRLEHNNVLRSWAITGSNHPPFSAGRVTMIRVDDHPLEWAEFEGTIPPGEYGAGPVEIWDKGTYSFRKKSTDKKWSITLLGNKLKGAYSILHIRDRVYYLIKKKTNA